MRNGEGKTIVVIPPVVGIVIVRVQPPAIVIAVSAEQVRVAVRKCAKYHLYHHSSSALRAVSNPASKCLNILHQVSSFFCEVSAYTTLSQTLVEDTLGVWILDSVGENLDRLRIHLIPILSYQRKIPMPSLQFLQTRHGENQSTKLKGSN